MDEGNRVEKGRDVVLVGSFRGGTGNEVTAKRIQHHLESTGLLRVTLINVICNHRDAVPSTMMPSGSVALGIHLYRCADVLLSNTAPYSVVLGGTDVNEYVRNQSALEVMGRVVEGARQVVAFHERLGAKFRGLWPQHAQKLVLIAPAVFVHSPPPDRPRGMLHQRLALPAETRVLLLVAGIRPVKDPIFLHAALSRYTGAPRFHLVLVGSVLDQAYYDQVVAPAFRASDRTTYLGPVPQEDLHAYMAESFAVINTSRSEGLANTLLEAMHLCVPVVARDVEGNRSIITHLNNGLLYDSPDAALDLLLRLAQDRPMAERIVRNANRFVQTHHSLAAERAAYDNLVSALWSDRKTP
mmetsp:Transcript_3859/g.10664  ORF Transcript_3859/g.10664 Transcript_3859/m.10664 type:complete len:355 (-) Transcript_3859:1539-2603(-)